MGTPGESLTAEEEEELYKAANDPSKCETLSEKDTRQLVARAHRAARSLERRLHAAVWLRVALTHDCRLSSTDKQKAEACRVVNGQEGSASGDSR